MKIGCDACGRAEAAVLCCADEAALCRRCDAAVHSANRLAGRHSRVELLPSSTTGAPSSSSNLLVGDGSGSHPACDICQEKTGYFFCLEDRALLCRPCDVAVHTAGAHVASHQRFLITGVRVGGGVECHDHVPGMDVVVSPSTSSGNDGSSSAPSSSSGNPMMTMPDKVRPSSAASAAEQQRSEQWPWSEFLAYDVATTAGVEVELCCPAGLSEPGSSTLTG